MRTTSEKVIVWVASIAFVAAVGAAAATVEWSKDDGPGTHTIVSTATDHPGDRCYLLLDADKKPIQMSCVAGKVSPWITTTTTAHW